MNIFKNVLTVAMEFALFFLFSCEKEQVDPSINSLTNEVGAIITKFDNGEVKIEFPYYVGFQKNEKVLNPDLSHKIRQELDQSYSKQTTYLKSAGNTVGVIKDVNETCGQYQELYIHMDCEDSGAASSESGWNGDCWVNSARNVILYFCVVNGAYFQATDVDYAVLDLSSASWPTGVSKIRNWMDNENSGNINACTQGGTRQANGYSTGGTNKLNYNYGETVVANTGTLLCYYCYPKIASSTPFPNLGGIHYGVFGSFGANQGSIFIDNEDGASSWVAINEWNGGGLGYEFSTPGYAYKGIVKEENNNNTTLYFSKVQ